MMTDRSKRELSGSVKPPSSEAIREANWRGYLRALVRDRGKHLDRFDRREIGKIADHLEALALTPVAWQPLPYTTPQGLFLAFRSGTKFVLHYHGRVFNVTHMEPREHVVYVRPPGLPVKVKPDGSSAEGPGTGIWLALTTPPVLPSHGRKVLIGQLTAFQEHFGIKSPQMTWKRTPCDDGIEMVHHDGDTIFFGDPNHQEPNDKARFDLIVQLANSVPSLIAALSAGADTREAWQPIETYPRDHFPRQLYGPCGQFVGFLDACWDWWPVPATESLGYKPTHWQPLQASPRSSTPTDGARE